MKRSALITLILVFVVCGGGGLALRSFQQSLAAGKQKKLETYKVVRGDLTVRVIDTGTIDAVKAVEVKSRVSGRLAKLLVEEGSFVRKGDLIAVIDPKETQLQVEQNQAQLRGAQAGANRTSIEIGQRRITARTAYERARLRVAQLEKELSVQPVLTRSAIESARTALATSRQQREIMLGSSHPNERTEASSAVAEAKANKENADQELARRKGLLEKGYVAGREVEAAVLQSSLAATRLVSANDRLSRLTSQQTLEAQQSAEKIRQAQADLDRAVANSIQNDVKRQEYQTGVASLREAEAGLRDVQALQQGRQQSLATVAQIGSGLAESRRQLGETEIRAPMDGIVTKRLVQEGELVASLSSFSSGTTIVRIENRQAMMVKLDINEIDVAKLAVGMKALVGVDAVQERKFEGRIRKIAPASKSLGSAAGQGSDTVVKYEVEIWLNQADPRLRSGMSAKCTLEAAKRTNAVLVPLEYLGSSGEERFVMIEPVTAKSPSSKRAVKVGLQTGSQAEIVDGLQEGERLVKPDYSGPKRKSMIELGGG